MKKKSNNFIFRVSGNSRIGSGHIFHSLALYNILLEKNDTSVFLLYNCDKFVEEELIEKNISYKYETSLDYDLKDLYKENNKNILINDVLNTDEQTIKTQKKYGYKVINIEDLGEGVFFSDAVINALYSEIDNLKNQYFGPDYTILRNEFEETRGTFNYVDNNLVLVSFGGVDPNQISEAIYYELIKTDLPFKIIEPPFRKLEINDSSILKKPIKVSKEMSKAKILVSSMGRTVFEAASLGIPILSVAQNERESKHINQYLEYINYLGEFEKLSPDVIIENLIKIYNDSITLENQRNMLLNLVDFKGAERIKNIIVNI